MSVKRYPVVLPELKYKYVDTAEYTTTDTAYTVVADETFNIADCGYCVIALVVFEHRSYHSSYTSTVRVTFETGGMSISREHPTNSTEYVKWQFIEFFMKEEISDTIRIVIEHKTSKSGYESYIKNIKIYIYVK